MDRMGLEFTQELGIWAYLLLALLVLVEGPIATLGGAIAASAGLMSPGWVFISASAGNLAADGLWYGLGYAGKTMWLERVGRWLGVKPGLVRQMMADINQHSGRLLFFAKLSLGFTIPALLATGLARVPMRRWFPGLLLAETIWTGLLVFAGFHFGLFVRSLERGVEWAALAGGLFFTAFIIYYLANLQRRRTEQDPVHPAPREKGYL
jgi:membrane protein DedA with SNARE-associated domain